MADGRFRGRRNFVRGSSKTVSSFATCSIFNGVVPVAGTVKALGSVGLITLQALTIIRSRGTIAGIVRTEAGADQIICGALGFILVSSDAFTIGVTAVPGPLTDSENDWFVWVPFGYGTFTGVDTTNLFFDKAFDSRGMRKSKPGDVVAPVLELEADVAGGSFDLAVTWRNQTKS